MPPPHPSYEYATLHVGIGMRKARKGEVIDTRPVLFRQMITVLGQELDMPWDGGPLDALNIAGAQGWQLLRRKYKRYRGKAKLDDTAEILLGTIRARDYRINGSKPEDAEDISNIHTIHDRWEFLLMREVRE